MLKISIVKVLCIFFYCIKLAQGVVLTYHKVYMLYQGSNTLTFLPDINNKQI